MRILVAPDKFKGSLGAAEVAGYIAAGLRHGLPDAEIVSMPVADGGEGTASVICRAARGEWQTCDVCDPLGNLVRARYCTIGDGNTAVMEMSEASGLWRVAPERRDPMAASTFGTGQMLLHAAGGGVQEIIIGLGGSATNDGGLGLARALGFRFSNAEGGELPPSLSEISRLAAITPPQHVCWPCIRAAADVDNPFLGPRGATRIFGPQKGVTLQQVEPIESALAHLAEIIRKDLRVDFREVAGAGAAGGLGFGLLSFCGATVQAGFDLVAELVGLEAAMREVDVVITGEGRLDSQTLAGKAPAGVARLARRFGKQIYAVVGEAEITSELRALFDGIIVARPEGMTRSAAQQNAPELLQAAAERLAKRLR
ncbi:MAG: glycerate kinase [Verrucomicrobiota bacterium]|nr:glycerate kinase [Verrucomicrobiota bacterium]